MKKLNLFIVDEDRSTIDTLKRDLNTRFGSNVNISVFKDGESCLQKVDDYTDVVILAPEIHSQSSGKNGIDILKSIKLLNPFTKVIMYSASKDIGMMIESFRKGAADFII